jgi:hypothetical protein
VHVTRPRRGGARTGRDLCVHSVLFDPGKIVVCDGIAVTSVVRTLVDLDRSVPFPQAVAVIDAALARELVTRQEPGSISGGRSAESSASSTAA